jgi:hypothetical protein
MTTRYTIRRTRQHFFNGKTQLNFRQDCWRITSVNAFHSGCIGDIIYSIPTLRELGCTHLYVNDRPWTKPILHRIGVYKRLLESQGIAVSPHEGEKIDHDLSTYRNGGLLYGQNIATRVANWMLVKPDLSKPWLSIGSKHPATKGKIVISRGARWHGEYFPWKQIVEELGEHCLFIGLQEELDAFCDQFGDVEYLPTEDLYEAAQAIAGSDLFIGNQSSPMAIAEGLKHKAIQECCLYAYDCIYNRHNKRNINCGELTFRFKGKEFKHTPELPKRGWEIVHNGKTYRAKDVHLAVAMCRADLTLAGQECSVDEITSWANRY